jgi:2-hydroxy-3-keto-5-methylthiopentenyl-1-phosphate phosphatase
MRKVEWTGASRYFKGNISRRLVERGDPLSATGWSREYACYHLDVAGTEQLMDEAAERCAHPRVALFDLDGTCTLYRTDPISYDTTELVNEHFSPKCPVHGQCWRGHRQDHSQKRIGTAQLLGAEYHDLFLGMISRAEKVAHLNRVLDWLEPLLEAPPGLHALMQFLEHQKISPVIASNGAKQFVDGVLEMLGLSHLPRVCNWFELSDDKDGCMFYTLNGDLGLDKGRFAHRLQRKHGKRVVACYGDSGGDKQMAMATAVLGGRVFARRGLALARLCEDPDHLAAAVHERWTPFHDFLETVPHLLLDSPLAP